MQVTNWQKLTEYLKFTAWNEMKCIFEKTYYDHVLEAKCDNFKFQKRITCTWKRRNGYAIFVNTI